MSLAATERPAPPPAIPPRDIRRAEEVCAKPHGDARASVAGSVEARVTELAKRYQRWGESRSVFLKGEVFAPSPEESSD